MKIRWSSNIRFEPVSQEGQGGEKREEGREKEREWLERERDGEKEGRGKGTKINLHKSLNGL